MTDHTQLKSELQDCYLKIDRLEAQVKKLEYELSGTRKANKEFAEQNRKLNQFAESVREKVYFYEHNLPEYLKDHPEIRDEIVKNFKQLIEWNNLNN
jgi:chromosome segregation ATPase